MFIVNLTYKKSMEEVDKILPNHIEFLQKYYNQKKFICSGRKNPRVGGIILCNADNINELNSIISEDPFNINDIAEYNIIEFIPTKCDDSFKAFIQ